MPLDSHSIFHLILHLQTEKKNTADSISNGLFAAVIAHFSRPQPWQSGGISTMFSSLAKVRQFDKDLIALALASNMICST